MNLRRIFQPRNPLFWLTLALNILSAGLVWIVQNRPLSTPVAVVIALFALSNALFGSWFMWRLVKDTPPHS